MKVVFILGSGHCGSTLLDMLLGAHPEITGVGELETAVSRLRAGERCTCHNRARSCPFWSDILRDVNTSYDWQIARRKLDTLRNKDVFYLARTNEMIVQDNYIQNQEKLYQNICVETGTDIIVDSSKNPERVALLAQSKKIDPIIIHLVRDGRGVLYSYLKKYNRTLPYIWRWMGSNLKTELVRYRLHPPNLFIRYRDLVVDTPAELRRIADLLDIPYKDEMLDFRDPVQHQIGGNRMRLQSTTEITEDLEWNICLRYADRTALNCIAGWLNWYYMHMKRQP